VNSRALRIASASFFLQTSAAVFSSGSSGLGAPTQLQYPTGRRGSNLQCRIPFMLQMLTSQSQGHSQAEELTSCMCQKRISVQFCPSCTREPHPPQNFKMPVSCQGTSVMCDEPLSTSKIGPSLTITSNVDSTRYK